VVFGQQAFELIQVATCGDQRGRWALRRPGTAGLSHHGDRQVSHEHGGAETVYVLAGTFVDQYRSSGPGTVIRGEPGSSHQPGTPDGVTFLVARTLAPGERERIAPRAPQS
jgi:anti-sigma factor ChrR (cupin superfamily)